MKESRLVYIASPYAGDIQSNVEFAKAACRFAVSQGATPLAVHLLYPQILDEIRMNELPEFKWDFVF